MLAKLTFFYMKFSDLLGFLKLNKVMCYVFLLITYEGTLVVEARDLSLSRGTNSISDFCHNRKRLSKENINPKKSIVLHKDLPFIDQVVYPNTIYEIYHDFVLNTYISLPHGCTLRFYGGKIIGGSINGNNSIISNNTNKPIFSGVEICDFKNLKYWYFDETYTGDDILRYCIEANDIVDFEGNVFGITQTVVINKSITIRNLSLVNKAENLEVMLLIRPDPNKLSYFCAEEISLDGNFKSSIGLDIFYVTNAIVKDCLLHNFFDTNGLGAIGINATRVDDLCINKCDICNIVGVPNGIVGDSAGASRAISIANCNKVSISDCYIRDVVSDEDGDAIHLINNDFMINDPAEVIYSKMINNCKIMSISRSCIKVQSKGVIIKKNTLLNDELREGQQMIRVYASNCRVINNTIKFKFPFAVWLGQTKEQCIANCRVERNKFITPGYAYQAPICSLCNLHNIKIRGNKIDITNHESTYYGIYLRGSMTECVVSNNRINLTSNKAFAINFRTESHDSSLNDLQIVKNKQNGGHAFAIFQSNRGKMYKNILFNSNKFNSQIVKSSDVIISPFADVITNNIIFN